MSRHRLTDETARDPGVKRVYELSADVPERKLLAPWLTFALLLGAVVTTVVALLLLLDLPAIASALALGGWTRIENAVTHIDHSEDGQVRLVEAAETLTATYRQVDWWCRQGYITATSKSSRGQDVDIGGCGFVRWVSAAEYSVLVRMDRLVEAGLTVALAASCARHANPSIAIAPGITLTIDPPRAVAE